MPQVPPTPVRATWRRVTPVVQHVASWIAWHSGHRPPAERGGIPANVTFAGGKRLTKLLRSRSVL